MIRDDGYFTSLTEKGTFRVLLALNRADGPLMQAELAPVIVNNHTRHQLLDLMEADGLIDIEVRQKPHRTYYVSLTPLGKEIAVILEMADSTVPGTEGEKSIELKYADPVLRKLLEEKTVMQADLLKLVQTYRYMTRVTEALESDGFIKKESPEGKQRPLMYSLTPSGKRMAETFELIYSKIRNRPGAPIS